VSQVPAAVKRSLTDAQIDDFQPVESFALQELSAQITRSKDRAYANHASRVKALSSRSAEIDAEIEKILNS
jgi:hypothetical protein